jgi:protoporphyrinogen oxidase
MKSAIIIGGGPAGLSAACELAEKTDIKPIVFECDSILGGISRTIDVHGNKMDLGGHRFFSKSKRVNDWWFNLLPAQCAPASDDIALDRKLYKSVPNCKADPEKSDEVMLLRRRVSHVLFGNEFYDYPISLGLKTLRNLGFVRTFKIGRDYLKVFFAPIEPEVTLEDFFINRFGKELYETFFKDYTQKVWGMECKKLKAEWGVQRIKSFSVSKAVLHYLKSFLPFKKKDVETTLIDRFYYPKFGPGQIWGKAADFVLKNGGEIHLNKKVVGFKTRDNDVVSVSVKDVKTGQISEHKADHFLSSMPIKDLAEGFDAIPGDVLNVARGLLYRDFISVGVLAKKLNLKDKTLMSDTWIYIQEKNIKAGRLQLFNNWSPYLLKDNKNVLLGLEYFCTEGDDFWQKSDEEISLFAVEELVKLGFVSKDDVLLSHTARMAKAYPVYYGSYDKFKLVREYFDKFENLFLIGRNGMHRYNNQDASMLSAFEAVKNIVSGVKTKDNIWQVNTERDYNG